MRNELRFTSLDGLPRSIPYEEVDALEQKLRGSLLGPGMEGYEEARHVWNGMIDRHPALIVQPVDSLDVAQAVRFAAKHGLLVSVKGGGHNVAGFAACDGGLMIDLSAMRRVAVDPVRLTATVQGGARWGDVDRVTAPYALAVPGGVVSTTGVAGLTLGGGLSWQRRAHGMTIDNLVAAQIVTADGEIRRASADESPDLFWALRGGGGNFGVVTEFTFAARAMGPDVAHIQTMYPLESFDAVAQGYLEYVATAPDPVTADLMVWSFPAVPMLPEALHGASFVAIQAVYAGGPEKGMRLLDPLRRLAPVLVDMSAVRPYAELQSTFDAFVPARSQSYYWKSHHLDRIDASALEALRPFVMERLSDKTLVSIRHLGGAIRDVAPDATAFGDRSSEFMLSIDATWTDPAEAEANVAWARGFWDAMRPHANGRMYLNFPGAMEEGEPLVATAYGRNYARLRRIKRRYDPANLFRLNANIVPASAAEPWTPPELVFM